ncbi:uncharacterized protein LOC132974985 [Labrus mixtus]|uniref:uncharacterized protein LOC132974985 n=1 Tax=Labrus mixtus TaxID=508554 RepID=UPI0029BFDF65|nr:uncharacterized protein LOC132974985 [Labrus mixtus]
MDSKLNGLLSHYILALILLEVHWRPVFLAPLNSRCYEDLDNLKSFAELLEMEATTLLMAYHDSFSDSTPDDVIDSTISGMKFYEKLQDIYIKNELFSLHFLKVDEYLQDLFGNEEPIKKLLPRFKDRLIDLSKRLQHILTTLHPDTPLPAKPEALTFNHDYDYDKKKYGWHVIDRVKYWLSQVAQVLDMGKEVCYEVISLDF